MYLPDHVKQCIEMLENAGHQAWAVGGCVRDAALGIAPHDYDLCTSALPEETQAVFQGFPLVLAGVKHGTVGVVLAGEVVEITTFRTEGGYQDLRHPGWVRFVPTVEEDLARRDFTINAMAWSPTRGYADPFGGLTDLENKVLRAVGDPAARFREDALRILRGARFAARFDLTIEDATWDAMCSEMAGLDALAVERIYAEMTKFLCLCDAEDLLRLRPILARIIPELGETMGFDQRNPHHQFDVFTHIAHVVQGVPREPVMRWAALLHDVGKPGTFTMGKDGRGHFYGHNELGATLANRILLRLKAPTHLRERAVWLIDHHMSQFAPEEKYVRRALSRHGQEKMEQLLALQLADRRGKGVEDGKREGELERFQTMLRRMAQSEGRICLKTLAVNGGDLVNLGCSPGPGLGKLLDRLLQQVVDGKLPNEREILLDQAKKWI